MVEISLAVWAKMVAFLHGVCYNENVLKCDGEVVRILILYNI